MKGLDQLNIGNPDTTKEWGETQSNIQPPQPTVSNLQSKDPFDQGYSFFGKIQSRAVNESGEYSCYARCTYFDKGSGRFTVELCIEDGSKQKRYRLQTLSCPLVFNQTYKGNINIQGGDWSRADLTDLK